MKKTQTYQRTVTNEAGEILQDQQDVIIDYGQEPDFIKLYLKDIIYLKNLPRGHENILWQLMQYANYANSKRGLCVGLTTTYKKDIMEALGINNVGTLDNALSNLVKGDILHRIDRGTYQLNPYFFGMGKWKDISNLRLVFDYNKIKGTTYQANVTFEEEENTTPINQAM